MNINRQQPRSGRLRTRTIVITVSFFVTILVVVNVFLAARLSHYGIHLSNLQKKAATLELQNQQLQTYLDHQGSLSELEQEAKKLGFTSEVHYLNLPGGNVASAE